METDWEGRGAKGEAAPSFLNGSANLPSFGQRWEKELLALSLSQATTGRWVQGAPASPAPTMMPRNQGQCRESVALSNSSADPTSSPIPLLLSPPQPHPAHFRLRGPEGPTKMLPPEPCGVDRGQQVFSQRWLPKSHQPRLDSCSPRAAQLSLTSYSWAAQS